MSETITRSFAADQLEQDLLDRINDGTLEPGAPLASISKLADRYDIAYGTARKAISRLVDRGLLRTRRGQGTFVASGAEIGTDPEAGQIALAYPLQMHPDILHRQQERVMRRGGMLSIQSADENRQDPELEGQFLRHVADAGYRGVGLFANPNPPLNTDLYHELRADGLKIALVSPHQYDVSQETVFLPNHRMGGYAAVKELRNRGFCRFCFIGRKDRAVYKDWILEGARRAAREFGGEIADLRQVPAPDNPGLHVEHSDLGHWIRDLDAETAVLTFRPDPAVQVEAIRNDAQGDACRCCTCCCFLGASLENVPHIRYDFAHLLGKVVDYLLDDRLPADVPVHKWIQPVFRPGYLRQE